VKNHILVPQGLHSRIFEGDQQLQPWTHLHWNWAHDIVSSSEGLESRYPSKHFLKDWGLVRQRNERSNFVNKTWSQKRRKEKVEHQDVKAVAFMLRFNWIRGMPWYFPKKIQGKDHWESLWHRKAYWMFSFNIARTYLEIMEMMMSYVLNIGTITITSNWFAKSKRHTQQTAIFWRHINKNPKYKGESSSDGDLVMTEDGQYYSEGEMIWSVTIHS